MSKISIIGTLQRGGYGVGDFAVATETDLQTSYITVATSTDRDNLPTWKRLAYMTVFVIGDNKEYQLGSDVTIAGQVWTPKTYGLPTDVVTESELFDSGGFIKPQYIQNIFLNTNFVVASQVAMLALTTFTGNFIIRTDTAEVWIKLNNTNPSSLSDFVLATPSASVISVNGQTGVVSITIANLLADTTNLTNFNNAVTSNATVAGNTASIGTLNSSLGTLNSTVTNNYTYNTSHLGVQTLDSSIIAPSGGMNGYIVTWNNSLGKFVLSAPPTGGGGGSVISGNAITISGSVVDLGGAFTIPTTVIGDLTTSGLFFDNGTYFTPGSTALWTGDINQYVLNTPGTVSGFATTSSEGAQIFCSSDTNTRRSNISTFLTSTTGAVQLNAASGGGSIGGQFTLRADSTDKFSILVQSFDPTFTGIEYDTDYSLNYTSNSLVAKGYVVATYLPLAGGTLTNFLTLNADPTSALHAATKSYVDNLVTGLSWKQAVQVATIVNITLSGLQTIDGYTTLANDRVLVKNQTTQTNNGIYIAASGIWARALDADIAAEILGSTVLVERGTLQADTQWSNNNTSIILGSTNITFAQIAGAGTYTNGTGLSLAGNVFSVTTNGITNALLRQSAGLSVIGNATNSTSNAADIVGANNQVLRVNGTTLGFGSIDLSQSATVGSSILPIANGGTGVVGGAWLQASGATLSASNTITSNTANWLNFSNTFTATANNQYAIGVAGTITARATASDTLVGDQFQRTLVSAAATQTLTAFLVNPTFTDVNSATKYIIRLQTAGIDQFTVTNAGVGALVGVLNAGGFKVTSNGNGLNAFSNSIGILNSGARDVSKAFIFSTLNLYDGASTTRTNVSIDPTFGWTSGTNVGTVLGLNSTINLTGGTTTIMGVDYNPTLTSQTGLTHYGLLIRPTAALNGFGTATPTGTVHIVGSGSNVTLKTVGAGTTTNYSYRAFQSDGTTEIYSLQDSGVTAYTSTWTATANNQNSFKSTQTITSRSTASDTVVGNYFNNVFNVNSTLINPSSMVLDYNAVMQGGLVTGSLFNKLSTPSTLAGMTATTYTSISAASTSGSGTGAVFTIVIGSATTITSVTVTTAGSGYKVGETITFNGSQFGAGTGSVVYTITSVTGQTLGNSAAVLRIINRLPSTFQGPNWKAIQFEDGDGDIIGSFQVKGGVGGRSIALVASTGITVFSTDGANLTIPIGVTFNNNIGAAAGTFSGSVSTSSGSSTSATGFSTGTSAFYHAGTKPQSIIANNSFFSSFTGQPLIVTGVVNTLGAITGGSGYTNGTYSNIVMTGGTGAGLTCSITVAGGAVTVCTISSKGSGYSAGDTLSALAANIGGTGSGFSIPVSTVDFSGVIVAGFTYAPSQSGASSTNSFYGFYGKPTYNLTSTFTGTVAAMWWDPTITSNTGNNYGVIVGPNNARSSLGTLTPLANLHIVQGAQSSGWVPALRIDPGADTSLTASTGFTHINITGATQTWIASGTPIPVQAAVWIQANTLAGATATATATVAATLQLDPWSVGSNGAITNNYTLYSTGKIGFTFTYTAGGTNGNQTINLPTGSLNIAAAGTTVTLTNSLITTNSIVYPVLMTTDATATSIKSAVVTSGQVVFTLNAACTAAVKIGFIVFN